MRTRHSQLQRASTDATALFNDSDAFRRSDWVCAAETKSLIPMGSRHLSSVDLLEATTKTESSFSICTIAKNWVMLSFRIWTHMDSNQRLSDNLTRSAISSSRWRSFFEEPVEFSSLRKTMGDSGLLTIERPRTSDNSAFAQHIYTRKVLNYEHAQQLKRFLPIHPSRKTKLAHIILPNRVVISSTCTAGF